MNPACLRTGFALLCAAALPMLSPAAWAGSAAASAAVVVSAAQPQIQIAGQGTRTMSSAEFAELRGEYRLQGGGLLAVGGARHRPVAELNGNAPVPLWPAGPNRLASADGRMQLAFRTHANGEVEALTLHVVPELLQGAGSF